MKEANCTSGTVGSTAQAEAKARWNPYLVGIGIGIGVLSWAAFRLLETRFKPTAESSISTG
jgi:hypothetical protein